MKFKLLKSILAGILCFTPFWAHFASATLIYSDESTFKTQLQTFITDDYSNATYEASQNDVDMSAVLGETQYTATGYVDTNLVFSEQYCAGCDGSFDLNFTTTSLGTSSGVYAVGFDIVLQAGAFPYDAFITFGDMTTLSVDLGLVPRFFGVTSSQLVKSISFGTGDGSEVVSVFGLYAIDNLTIGNQKVTDVPEPSTLALFALGMIGLASRRVKKQS